MKENAVLLFVLINLKLYQNHSKKHRRITSQVWPLSRVELEITTPRSLPHRKHPPKRTGLPDSGTTTIGREAEGMTTRSIVQRLHDGY